MKRIAIGVFLLTVSVASNAEGFAAWLLQNSRQVSSYRVGTKQIQVSTEARISSRQHTLLSQAQAADERYNIDAVRDTLLTYGPESQLVDPCYQVAMAGTVVNTKASTDDRAQEAVAKVYSTSAEGYANAGGVGGFFGGTSKVSGYTYAAGVGQRQKRHLDRYCSTSEAELGYCTLQANGMQGGDVDFSVHLAPGTTYGWDQTEAATDFVKTVAPVRPVPVGKCGDATCRAALQSRRQQESYLSMSRYSMLRFVESRSTQLNGVAKKVVKDQ